MNSPTECSSYRNIRKYLATGDLVFFSGNGFVSRFIRFVTWSPYSHVAIVLRQEDDRVVLMESTSIGGGFRGVQKSYLSERLQDYDGQADVKFLSLEQYPYLRISEGIKFLEKCEGKPYDTKGALWAGLGQLFRIPGKTRLDALFCSELADAFFCACGLVYGNDRTPTPEELAERSLFRRSVHIETS